MSNQENIIELNFEEKDYILKGLNMLRLELWNQNLFKNVQEIDGIREKMIGKPFEKSLRGELTKAILI